MEREDAEFIEAFLARRPDAFEALYRRYVDVCFTAASHVLRSRDEAMDCVHDALLHVWERPDAYRPERGALRSFLVVCVRNEALMRLRSAGRHRAIEARELLPAEGVVELEIDDHLERARIRRALDSLPDDQRRALDLAFFGGRTHREIAELLGEPLGTVKSRVALGLRRVGRELRAGEQPA